MVDFSQISPIFPTIDQATQLPPIVREMEHSRYITRHTSRRMQLQGCMRYLKGYSLSMACKHKHDTLVRNWLSFQILLHTIASCLDRMS